MVENLLDSRTVLFDVLKDMGFNMSKKSNRLKLSDILQDSLSYISFFVSLENKLNILFPDEFYFSNIYELNLDEFLEKVNGLIEDKTFK